MFVDWLIAALLLFISAILLVIMAYIFTFVPKIIGFDEILEEDESFYPCLSCNGGVLKQELYLYDDIWRFQCDSCGSETDLPV